MQSLSLPHSLASCTELNKQDNDFKDLPEDQLFGFTLEQPTKFGYSPSCIPAIAIGSATAGDGCDNDIDGILEPTPGVDLLPPSAPELSRSCTAPATTDRPGSLGGHNGGAGTFMGRPMPYSADGGAVGDGHQRRETYDEHRFDSVGSAAEWDKTLEGMGRYGLPHTAVWY